MTTIELKNNFHQLIDHIDDAAILSKFYTILERASETHTGKLWNRLSDADQQELLQIDSDTDADDHLIPQSVIQEKHKKWL